MRLETASARAATALLDGIDLVVFDKDGTLIEFQAMWGGWVEALGADLRRATGQPIAEALFELLGVDPDSGLILAHGLMAATPMSRIREAVLLLVADRAGSLAEAEAALAASWHPPDPVVLARPIGDLVGLLGDLRRSGRHVAVATADDRDPTERTLAALGVAALVDRVACADDGVPVKPAPDAILGLCRTLGVAPERTAMVGDSVADLRMGRAAGAGRVIAVLTGVGDQTTLEPLADIVLESIEKLLPI